MAEKSLTGVVRHIRQLAAVQACRELSDRELIEQFVATRDQAAFTTLVERHCALVLGVCRRRLGNLHDAEDACQATFLVLARKAASVRKAASLGCWLHRVARSVAANLRRERLRRERRERTVSPAASRDFATDVCWREVQVALDEEIARLPERFRAPVILCYLDGQTRDEAAERLGLSPGCLHGRLERGRRMLSDRLTQRGVTLSGVLLAAAVGQGTARASLSATTVVALSRAALAHARGQAPAAGGVSTGVLSLARGASGRPVMSKIIYATALAAGALLTAVGAGHRVGTGPDAPAKQTPSGAQGGAIAAASDSLEGEWQATEMESGGEKVPPKQARELSLTVKGSEAFTKNARGEGEMRKATIKTDPGRSPKTIDFTSLDGPQKGQTIAGIYSLKDGLLTICFSEKDAAKRPSEFKTLPGDGRILIVLERVGPNGVGGAAPPANRRVVPATILGGTGAKGPGTAPPAKAPRSASEEEFAAIQREWQAAESAFWAGYEKAKSSADRQTARNELAAKSGALAQRCMKLADAEPARPEALSALCWAFCKSPESDAGKRALALLKGGRIARSNPAALATALNVTSVTGLKGQELVPAVLDVAKRNLDHPRAARLATWVCANYYRDHSAVVPPAFAEAAALIGDHFVESPDISNFCECLGPMGDAPPPWAGQYEPLLRTILARNRDRLVRATASFALAEVVLRAGNARRDEAVQLFEQFVKDFKADDPRTENVESNLQQLARVRLKEIRLRAPGMPAPEIDARDLDGKPMKLSQFRGKVVLLSFWATTCEPCMKLLPVERALAERLRDRPFAIVGVNFDSDAAAIKRAVNEHKITWPSFPVKAAGNKWSVDGIPTLYLIDDTGIIRKHWPDAPPADELNRTIDQLIDAAITRQRNAERNPGER